MAGATSGRAGIVEFVTYCVFSMGYGFSMGIYLLYFIYIFFLYIHVHVHVQMCPDAHVHMSMSMSIFMSMCVCECLMLAYIRSKTSRASTVSTRTGHRRPPRYGKVLYELGTEY